MTVIDVHAHCGTWFFSGSARADISENVRVMDAYGIDVQLVSGVEAVTYDPLLGNELTLQACADEPRVRPMFVIDPRELDVCARQFRELGGAERFAGFKVHTHYSSTPAGSPLMADMLAFAADADLPVLVHTWGHEVIDLAHNVAATPGVKAIAGHMGGPSWNRAPEAVAVTDRLWLEPCYSHSPTGRIRWVLDRIPLERMLFGTDSTLIDPAVTIGAFTAAELSVAEAEAIMWRNALELFGPGILSR